MGIYIKKSKAEREQEECEVELAVYGSGMAKTLAKFQLHFSPVRIDASIIIKPPGPPDSED